MFLIAANQDHDLARTEFDGLVEKAARQQITSEGMILVANICRRRSLVGEIRKDNSGASALAVAAGLEQALHRRRDAQPGRTGSRRVRLPKGIIDD